MLTGSCERARVQLRQNQRALQCLRQEGCESHVGLMAITDEELLDASVEPSEACDQFVEYLADLAKSLGGIARATQGDDVRNAALQAYETAVAAYTTRLKAMRDHDPPQLALTEFKARYKTALQVKGQSVSLFLQAPSGADQRT